VSFIDESEMRVDLHDVYRTLIRKRGHTRDVNRMVTTNDDRHRSGTQDRTHAGFDVSVAGKRIRVYDVRIAKIDDSRVCQISHVILVVVGTGIAERKQCGSLANAPRTEPAARAPLGAEIEWRAQYCDIGIDPGPIGFVRCLCKRWNPDKGQIQSTSLVSMSHFLSYPMEFSERPMTSLDLDPLYYRRQIS